MSALARAFCWSAARSAPAALPVHLVFMLAAFQSSDLRSTGTIISQAVVLSVAMVLLWRRPWPTLAGWEVAVFAVALLFFFLPGLATWTIASQPLLATTQVRAWACWLLLFAVAALSRREGRFWLPVLWLPALAALLVFRGGHAPWWYGEGTPLSARLLLAPSLALALHTGILGRVRWLLPLRVVLALLLAAYFLILAGSADLFAFLAVYVFVSRHRRWSVPYACGFVLWWTLAVPHLWLDREEAMLPALARLHARVVAAAPEYVLAQPPGYGWEALATASAALPFGAGPGHETALLAGSRLPPHPYTIPGAFIWEGLCALGYGFFLALAGFLLLQMVGDQAEDDDPTAPRARAMLVGLWTASFLVPFSGFLSNPLWWMALGVLYSARPVAARGYRRGLRATAHAGALALFLLCAFPLMQQVAAGWVFAHPQDTAGISAADAPALARARRLEPQNGAYAFGLAHAVYAANLAEHNLRLQAVNDEVLALLSEAVAKEPYNGVYRWVYSRFLLLAGRWDAALAQEQRAIALAPRRLEYRRSMAETCENLGRLQLALAEYRACADLSPFDPELRLAIARVLVALKEPEAARLEYEKVLRLAPDDPIARSYLERHPRPDAQHVF